MTNQAKLALTAGAAVLTIVLAHAQPSPALEPTLTVLAVGAKHMTVEALDCYGNERALRHVTEARAKWEPTAADYARYTSMIDSDGTTLDADQRFVVVTVHGAAVELRLEGGTFDHFECWVNASDAAEVTQ